MPKGFWIIIQTATLALAIYILIWLRQANEVANIEIDLSENPFIINNISDRQNSGLSDLSSRILKIEIPEKLPYGERAAVRVFLLPVESNATLRQNNQHLSNETFYFIEARLELLNAGVEPMGTIRERLLPGEQGSFFWVLQPENPAIYNGTLWIFLAENGTSDDHMAILARPVEIECVSLFHLRKTTLLWFSILLLSLNIGVWGIKNYSRLFDVGKVMIK